MTAKNCKWYENGKCNHSDAPNPTHSWCIGQRDCNVYEKIVGYINDLKTQKVNND